jgi:hypothetical protein
MSKWSDIVDVVRTGAAHQAAEGKLVVAYRDGLGRTDRQDLFFLEGFRRDDAEHHDAHTDMPEGRTPGRTRQTEEPPEPRRHADVGKPGAREDFRNRSGDHPWPAGSGRRRVKALGYGIDVAALPGSSGPNGTASKQRHHQRAEGEVEERRPTEIFSPVSASSASG